MNLAVSTHGTIQTLSAALTVQALALSVGARVEHRVHFTRRFLYEQLDQLTGTFAVEESSEPDCSPALHASRCRAFLLEIVRRAAHDWVLYRFTSRLDKRQLALNAYTWLFEEKPGHPWWELRQREGEPFLAFLNICETLDIPPDRIRERVKAMTMRDIVTAGRPAEHRHHQVKGKMSGVEDYESPPELSLIAFGSHFADHQLDSLFY